MKKTIDDLSEVIRNMPARIRGIFYTSVTTLGFFSVLFFQFVKLISLILAACTIFVIYYFLYSLPRKIKERKKIQYERVLPLLKQNFKFIMEAFDDSYDILRILTGIVASLNINIISQDMRRIYRRIMLGALPEDEYLQYHTPSRKFNDFLYLCAFPSSQRVELMSAENFSDFKSFMKTIESRMVIIVAEGIFLPILSATFFLFISNARIVALFLVGFHYFIINYLSKNLLKKDTSLIYYKDIIGHSHTNELDDFISLLDYLGQFIQMDSPEIAILKTVNHLKKSQRETLGFLHSREIQVSYKGILDLIFRHVSNETVRIISHLLKHLVMYSGTDLGTFIMFISKELQDQRELNDEKETIIEGEKFKVKIILFCLPVILSILTALLPHFLMDSRINDYLPILSFNTIDLITFFMLNVMYISITTYFLTQIAGIVKKLVFMLLSLFCFIILFVLVNGMASMVMIFG